MPVNCIRDVLLYRNIFSSNSVLHLGTHSNQKNVGNNKSPFENGETYMIYS